MANKKEQRSEADIRADHGAAVEQLRENPDSSEHRSIVLGFGDELSAHLSDGAKNCPNPEAHKLIDGVMVIEPCDRPPMGMLKRPAYRDRDGIDQPPVYEVGCIYCPPFLQEREDGVAVKVNGEAVTVKRRSYSARANKPEDAVAKWNAEDLLEDTLLDRIPGYVPEFV